MFLSETIYETCPRLQEEGMDFNTLDFIDGPRANSKDETSDDLKSSSLEHLIAQNEDSAARLKVSLRRLALIEEENKKIKEEYLRISEAFTNAKDQLLVSKEKDKAWKTKFETVQRDAREAIERAQILEQSNARMNIELERHQRYQLRVRDQIKPYVHSLKEYSKKLGDRNAELEKEIIRRESQLHTIREQIEKLTQTAAEQIHITQEKLDRVTSIYEKERREWLKDAEKVVVLESEIDQAKLKISRLNEKIAVLENENIEVRRLKETQRTEFISEIDQLQMRATELTNHNQKLGMEHSDLQLRVLEDAETIKNLRAELAQQREQLNSVRYLWNQKNDETESLKLAMSSLEKINIDLSQKLNDVRNQTASNQE
jgi:chromosome segregation ATPase